MALKSPILLTGATGYVGGRLLQALESEKIPVRVLARRPEALTGRIQSTTKVVAGDVLDSASLRKALKGIHTAFYLVHSLGAGTDFESIEYESAKQFAHACVINKVKKIVYLGGLGSSASRLSPHLRSRQKVGEILMASGIPVVEFRASIIIGSGSLSFEMIRALVERLPVMITPRWIYTLAQPIGIEDVIAYLRKAISYRGPSRVFEIGGPERVSYGELMKEYARQRGLRRWMISVPVLTPRLSSLWLGLVTPLYARVGRKLVESMRYPTVVSHDEATRIFNMAPSGYAEAIARAIQSDEGRPAATRWSDALSSAGPSRPPEAVAFGKRRMDRRTQFVKAPASRVFRVVSRVGGKTGWYYANPLWKIRGFLDLFVGGVGLRRGRRDSETLSVGDALDFWRVEAFDSDKRLRLRAEMKLPGRAWLEFDVSGKGKGCTLRQTALFDPLGWRGWVYWYLLYPFHAFIFKGMLRRISELAEKELV